MKKTIRVYADTSVFGGLFDEEFQEASRRFFDLIKAGDFRLVISSAVSDELYEAPEQVRGFFYDLAPHVEIVEIEDVAIDLQMAYLAANIVGSRWETDALHVAMATVSDCRAIVSWNFKHIVNFRRIPLYNGVNMAHGYPTIGIHTPQEMLIYEDEDEDETF